MQKGNPAEAGHRLRPERLYTGSSLRIISPCVIRCLALCAKCAICPTGYAFRLPEDSAMLVAAGGFYQRRTALLPLRRRSRFRSSRMAGDLAAPDRTGRRQSRLLCPKCSNCSIRKSRPRAGLHEWRVDKQGCIKRRCNSPDFLTFVLTSLYLERKCAISK